MPLLKSLNKEQKEAVLHSDGPLLIIAGAGSGKTMALTHRIAYLIKNKNVSPFSILAVTFTNKAADEMKNRLEKLTGASAKNIWIGTFHSICGRILRADITKLGRDNNFVIFDSDDQKSLMKQVLKELNLDIKQYRPNAILDSISRAKNELINEREYTGKASDLWEEKVAQCYKLYQAKLLKNNALDFDDMLMQAVLLLKNSPQTAKKYQDRFQYVHVDEYQDTNHAQYMLANLLSFKHKNICVVGDDDQSIYAFRGADIKNILEFERDYPNAHVIKLEENYRSTQNILNAANFVVSNNFMRKNKKLWTNNKTGEKIVHYEAKDEKDEAFYIANKISALKKEMDLKHIAVLYRTNAQSRAIEEALIKWGIPYKIVGGFRFFERKEIKDIVSLLRIIYNPNDDLSCVRAIGTLADGIGKTTITKLEQQAKQNNSSIMEVIDKPSSSEFFCHFSSKIHNSLMRFHKQIKYFTASISDLTASEIVKKILDETDYIKNLENEKTEESISRIENIRELLSVAIDFEEKSDDASLESFLLFMPLASDRETQDKSNSFVTLITLHAVKGLEFPVIFIAGMEEGLFPHFRSMMDPANLEEERRLCYVGLTRAKNKLYILSATKRMIFGEERYGSLSRFISEIPEDLIVRETLDDIVIKFKKHEKRR